MSMITLSSETERHHKLLHEMEPRRRTTVIPSDVESSHIKMEQEDPEPPHIKMEHKNQKDPEHSHIKVEQQEGELPQGLEGAVITKFPFTPVPVKSEDDDEDEAQSSQLHHMEPDGEDCGGPGSAGNSHPDNMSEVSSGCDTEDSDDWQETRGPQLALRTNEVPDLRPRTGEKPFGCSECGTRFSYRGSLKRHMLIHTGDKLHSCSVCEKSFTERSNLRNHMLTHTGEKPHSCSVCEKSFTQSKSLSIHMLTHTGEKPHSCSVCQKSFKERMRRNLNAAAALKMFRDLESGDSDGGNLSELGNESDHSWVHENTSLGSDSEPVPRKKRQLSPATMSYTTQGLPEPALEPTGVLSPPLVSSQPEAAVEKGKDGTVWMVLQPDGHPGRRQSQNVLTEAAGPTAHAKRNVKDALTAFLCVFDDGMLKHIRDCTVTEAHRDHGNSSWDLTVAELKAFIALLYVRGAQCAKNIDIDSLWSEEWGFPFFRQTMSRNRFRDIMRFLRFDRKETRHVRLQEDKFALVRATWDRFTQNSAACYKPGANITIAEQLFPTKARCKFTQYMGNKPDKFGIKFWLAADVDSKYMLNGFPYLGKDETRSAGQLVGESVVLKLAGPFLGKGRNVTTDNFFTSLKLATTLQAKKTSLVGTMGKQKRELPPSVKEQAELFSTKVLKCGEATLTVYQGKPRKSVCILSTVHTGVGTFSGPKAKPESVVYYNNTKYGVDVLDQMARAYSVKGGTRRWPVAVFYNILDLAGINSHILFKECTGSRIAQRKFLQQLAEELRAEFMEGKGAARQAAQAGQQRKPLPQQQQAQKRRQCQVRISCKQNKTSDTCSKCHKPVCGSCARRAEVICLSCDH